MINLSIENLIKLSTRPELFAPGEEHFWDDPHIAKQMLKTHLNPKTDRASYKPETIDKIVKFTINYLKLNNSSHILDAGCGPGLYCEKFRTAGVQVTGIDISASSIEYAKQSAKQKNLEVSYINSSYLDMEFKECFDAIFIIWHDFCVMNFYERSKLLRLIHQALKPGGYFVFDVSTPYDESNFDDESSWFAVESGFWSNMPHFVLESAFYYPTEQIRLFQNLVITNDSIKNYRIYHTHYTKESITELLLEHGFGIQDLYSDLTGKAYHENAKSMGIFAKKQ